MLASPIFLQTSPGAINWGPGGTVQNLHFCYFLHNELVTDPMWGSDLLVKRWKKPNVPNAWNGSEAEALGRSILWMLWGDINSWILQTPGTGQKSLWVRHGHRQSRQYCCLFIFPSSLSLHLFWFFYSRFLLCYFSAFYHFNFHPHKFLLQWQQGFPHGRAADCWWRLRLVTIFWLSFLHMQLSAIKNWRAITRFPQH